MTVMTTMATMTAMIFTCGVIYLGGEIKYG